MTDTTTRSMDTSESQQHSLDDLRAQLVRLSPRTLAILHAVLTDFEDEEDE